MKGEIKVGKHEAETILWLNFLSEDDIRARESVQEFYGQCSDMERARQIDKLEVIFGKEVE